MEENGGGGKIQETEMRRQLCEKKKKEIDKQIGMMKNAKMEGPVQVVVNRERNRRKGILEGEIKKQESRSNLIRNLLGGMGR